MNLSTSTVITSASFLTDEITFTSVDHGLAIGNSVVVSNVLPSAYNGTYLVTAVADDDTFTVSKLINP